MIVTCTMNPSLDYYMEFPKDVESATINRSTLEYYEAGGKGINVSIVLNNLGIPTKAFGFVGGFTKDFYISLLAKYENIHPNFVYTNAHTRVNVKIHDKDEVTDLHAMGPYITHEDMQSLVKKTESIYKQDYFVLAGNTQEWLIDDVEEMLKTLIEEGVKVTLDTNVKIMKDMLSYKPFLYKTTSKELAQILDTEINSDEDAINGAKKLYELGAKHVLVLTDTLAILVNDHGTFTCEFLDEDSIVNAVGTGDSMIAGFLMNYMRTSDSYDSLKFGASCGSATAYSKGLATREKIDAIYQNTVVNKID